MAYVTLAKLLDQQCVSDLNMGIVLKTSVHHVQMMIYVRCNPH